MKHPLAAAFMLLVLTGGIALSRIDAGRRSVAVAPGATIGPIEARTLEGRAWSADSLSGRAWLLVYVNERCAHCHAQLAAWERAAADSMEMAHLAMFVASRRIYDSSSVPPLPDGFPHQRILDSDGTIATALGITIVPTTVVLSGSRIEAVYEGPVAPATLLAGLTAGKEPR